MGQGCRSSRIRWLNRHLPPFFLFCYPSNGGGTATDTRVEGHDYFSPCHFCLQAFRHNPLPATPRHALRHSCPGRQAARFPRSCRPSGSWNTGGNCTPVYPISNFSNRCCRDNFLDALVVRRQPLLRASMNGKNCACSQVQFFLVIV